jgi:hypothetical protein
MKHLLEIGDQISAYGNLPKWPYQDAVYIITRVTKTVAYGEYKGEVIAFNRKALYGVVLPKARKREDRISYRLGDIFNKICNEK